MKEERFLQIMQRFCLLVSIGIIGLFVINLAACKTIETNVVKQSTVGEMTYSYIDIDPLVIGQTWEEVTRVPLSQFIVEMYFKNPDIDAPIQFASLIVTPAGVAGYSYMLDGKINICEFNDKTNAYESGLDSISEESKQVWYDDYKTYFGLSGS